MNQPKASSPLADKPVPRKRKRCRRNPHNGSMAADLYLPIPLLDSSSSRRGILIQQLSRRLSETDYRLAAFTHTVYGKPKPSVDAVDKVLSNNDLLVQPTNGKSTVVSDLRVLRRLHAVVENLSDAGCFVKQSGNAQEAALLDEYDIVSIAPRNEAVFRSVISSATACDIITLDYTVQKSGLPFRVRPTDMRIIAERQLILEIPYAPAVLNPSLRKSWIQTCAEVQQASRGQKNVMILLSSSGERKVENNVNDAADMAIRMPKDLQNLATTVHGLPKFQMGAAAKYAVSRAQRRKYGSNFIERIDFGEVNDKQESIKADAGYSCTKKAKTIRASTAKKAVDNDDDDDSDDVGDGFIAM